MCGGSRADNFPLFWSNANQRGKVIFRRVGYRIVSLVLCCGCVVFYWAVVNGGGDARPISNLPVGGFRRPRRARRQIPPVLCFRTNEGDKRHVMMMTIMIATTAAAATAVTTITNLMVGRRRGSF